MMDLNLASKAAKSGNPLRLYTIQHNTIACKGENRLKLKPNGRN